MKTMQIHGHKHKQVFTRDKKRTVVLKKNLLQVIRNINFIIKCAANTEAMQTQQLPSKKTPAGGATVTTT